MTGLLSAGIELEPHQIEVARRVLQDPVQRYLLADEVGLGKTIEAGIIIRQFVLDDPTGHEVLVVVPPHLVDQWIAELSRRFALDSTSDRGIQVVPYDRVDTALAAGAPRMLVIDEAHQLATLVTAPIGSLDRQRFRRVCEAAAAAERLLLLSATPSLHNDAGFQAMLHLLDPTVYPLGDLEAFQARRESHQRVAELFHVFHPHESGSFLNDCLDDLTAMFPADARLRSLADQLRPLLGYGQDPTSDRRANLVQDIRCHVSEAYRLHRRLLRNRRADSRVEAILPGRAGLAVWEYDDPASGLIDDLLEEWRAIAARWAAARPNDRDRLAELLRLFWDAAADPLALALLADARRGEPDSEQVAGLVLTTAEQAALASAPLPDEEDILRRLADAAVQTENLDRADTVVDNIAGVWAKQPDTRVVLFTTFARTADEVRDALAARWRPAVVRHGQTGWEQSWADKAARILVCDRSAEEGLNLQGGRIVLVHYDLPMAPNRIEQRLGRVDRYGVGRAVRSAVPVARAAAVPRAWCDVLNATFRVFDRSIAALQYLVEDELPGLRAGLLFDGPDALTAATDRLGGLNGEVEKTLRQIQVLDELDAVETTQAQRHFADRLIECELLRETGWLEAFRAWTVDRLHFRERHGRESNGQVLRFQIQRPTPREQEWNRRRHQPSHFTLVPVGRFIERFRHVMDDVASKENFREPITRPMTFACSYARSRGIPLARVGHPFIEAMAEYVRLDDSGIAFGLWRWLPSWNGATQSADLAFRFDFLIEGRINDAWDSLPSESANTRPAVRRLADQLLPPDLLTVWVDETGEPLSDPQRLAVFAAPYLEGGSENEGRDVNLNPDLWRMIETLFPPGEWADRVREACAGADRALHRHLHASGRLAELAQQAREQAATRRSQLLSRVAFLPAGEREIEHARAADDDRLWAALVAGVERPSVRLDALGAVFASAQDPFAAQDPLTEVE
jgi:ATP-dependent helicase HepA